MPSRIRERYMSIRESMDKAALRAGRNPEDVKLIAVSKFQTADAVAEAVNAGLRHFGENRFQETPAKIETIRNQFPDLQDQLRWSFIGGLQSNKVKPVLEWFDSIQSIDRIKLLNRVDRISEELGITPEILIQVNVSEADTQGGINLDDLSELLGVGSELKHIRINGLMAIGPNTDDEAEIRTAFKNVRKAADRVLELNLPGISMDILSMGMTGDFEIAIEEGSTLVRIGTALFGPRST